MESALRRAARPQQVGLVPAAQAVGLHLSGVLGGLDEAAAAQIDGRVVAGAVLVVSKQRMSPFFRSEMLLIFAKELSAAWDAAVPLTE